MKKVYAKERYCINCHLCEVYCITAHSATGDVIKAHKLEPVTPLSRVRVEERHPRSFALQCRHCPEPLCVLSCISGAMTKDPETGVVSCDTSKCVGCWTCVAACRVGAVQPGYNNGRKVALKCDLCAGKNEPACVAHCPNGALVWEERGEA